MSLIIDEKKETRLNSQACVIEKPGEPSLIGPDLKSINGWLDLMYSETCIKRTPYQADTLYYVDTSLRP